MRIKTKKNILVLGISGSFASGKSTVTLMFKHLGACCIDADKIYHNLIKPKESLYKKIVSFFGKKILAKNKQIDRKRLTDIVFVNKKSLAKLSCLTHPEIIKAMRRKLINFKKNKRCKVVVIDAPLLIEADISRMIDKLIVVNINQRNQIQRITKLRGLVTSKARERIKAQLPLRQKVKVADYVIDNNGSLGQTRKQVIDIWKKLGGK